MKLSRTYDGHFSRGSGEKHVIFQIASGPILSIPIHSNTCQYDPCKVSLEKMTLSLPMNLPKSAFFGSSDWASDWLVTDPVMALTKEIPLLEAANPH